MADVTKVSKLLQTVLVYKWELYQCVIVSLHIVSLRSLSMRTESSKQGKRRPKLKLSQDTEYKIIKNIRFIHDLGILFISFNLFALIKLFSFIVINTCNYDLVLHFQSTNV